jgi:hypothetical protein
MVDFDDRMEALDGIALIHGESANMLEGEYPTVQRTDISRSCTDLSEKTPRFAYFEESFTCDGMMDSHDTDNHVRVSIVALSSGMTTNGIEGRSILRICVRKGTECVNWSCGGWLGTIS